MPTYLRFMPILLLLSACGTKPSARTPRKVRPSPTVDFLGSWNLGRVQFYFEWNDQLKEQFPELVAPTILGNETILNVGPHRVSHRQSRFAIGGKRYAIPPKSLLYVFLRRQNGETIPFNFHPYRLELKTVPDEIPFVVTSQNTRPVRLNVMETTFRALSYGDCQLAITQRGLTIQSKRVSASPGDVIELHHSGAYRVKK